MDPTTSSSGGDASSEETVPVETPFSGTAATDVPSPPPRRRQLVPPSLYTPRQSSQSPAPVPVKLYAPLFSLLNPVEDSATLPVTVTTVFEDERCRRPEMRSNGAPASSPSAPCTREVLEAAPVLSSGHTTTSMSPSFALPLQPQHAVEEAFQSVGDGDTTTHASRLQGCCAWWARLRAVLQAMHTQMAQEVIPVTEPRCCSTTDLAKMARYESVDTYEAESALYKDHLETRSHEPRWFMWVFVLLLGVSTSALALGVVAVLHTLNAIRYELLGFGLRGFSFEDAHRYPNARNHNSTSLDVLSVLRGDNIGLYGLAAPRYYGYGYLLWLLFALVVSVLASFVSFLVPESVGSGVPEVKAYLNGVSYPMLGSTRVLMAKVTAVVLTVSSGVCTGHYGHLMLAGAMLGAQLLQRRQGLRCYHVHFVECFRNPRDRRVLVVIGAAAGIASAFCVSVGGLLVILELLSAVFPVRFALHVFATCLLSSLCTQVYLSCGANWARGNSSGSAGELPCEAVVPFRSPLPFGEHATMNLLDFVPALVIGVCCGACGVAFVRMSWISLYCRRRLEVKLRSKKIRFVLPVLFTLLYVSVHYWIAVAFTHDSGVAASDETRNHSDVHLSPSAGATETPLPIMCRAVPYAVRSGRNLTAISFYGLNGFLCPSEAAPKWSTTTTTVDAASSPPLDVGVIDLRTGVGWRMDTARNLEELKEVHTEQSVRVLDAYASLAFAYPDSALQTLLSQRTADMLPWPALLVYAFLYFISSALYSGLALCGDTLLPSLVIGAALGRCIGAVVHAVALSVSRDTSSWADPGVFALLGAGSFATATSGLSFSVGAILIESTADFRHLLPLLFAILVARRVLAGWSRDAMTVYLETRAVPLLNVEPYLNRYGLLDARDVMHAPVVSLPIVCSLAELTGVLRDTTHHAFPVLSLHDGTYKGTVTRSQLEQLLWHLILTQGRATHCTYDVLQRVEDHVFHNGWAADAPTNFVPADRLGHTQVSLYPHVDTSAFTVLDTTALPRTYEVFTTLGLRHLIVVDRDNFAVGLITRKDLVGDRIARAYVEGGGVAARARAVQLLSAPLHPTSKNLAEAARPSSSSTRQPEQRKKPGERGEMLTGARGSFAFGNRRGEAHYAQTLRRMSLLQLPRHAGTLPGMTE